MNKVQTYKAVSFALPLKVHEEIFEKDKTGITRYCVLYELLENQRSLELRNLSKLCETWNLDAGNARETFSLEKCFYLFLKLMLLLGKLEELDVYTYTEMNMDNLVLDSVSQQLYLNTEMGSSFKLHKVTGGFLQVPLFAQLDRLYFQAEHIVSGREPLKYNNRLLIGLIMSQILSRCEDKVRLARSESAYHEKMYSIVTGLMDRFREPPSLNANGIDLLAEEKRLNVQAVDDGTLLPYTTLLMLERKWEALVKLYPEAESVLDEIVSSKKKAQVFFNFAKAYRLGKLEPYCQMALTLFKRCIEHLSQSKGAQRHDMHAEALYQMAKCHFQMITDSSSNHVELTFSYAQESYKITFRQHGDYSPMCAKLLKLQGRCYLKLGDRESAIRYMEQELKIQNELHG